MADLIQRNFASGEIAPSMRSRVDTVMYQNGLALCENFIVKAQGGLYSRPGTRFIDSVGKQTRVARLIPFSFSTAQTYMLVFEHLSVRILKNGAYLLNANGTVYEVATPYTDLQLQELYFIQSADVMTIVHSSHPIKSLSRLSDGSVIPLSSPVWSLEDDVFIAPIAPTGITLLNVGPLAGSGSPLTKTYEYVVTWVDSKGVESLPSAPVALLSASLSTVYGVNVVIPIQAGAISFRVYKATSDGSQTYGWIGDTNANVSAAAVTAAQTGVDNANAALAAAFNSGIIAFITSAQTNLTAALAALAAVSAGAGFKDFNLAPIMSDGPPSDRSPLSSANNYPSTCAYYQQRRVFASTLNEPQTVFTTQTGNYKSFRVSNPTKSDDAVTFTIADNQVNEIRHILSLGSLIILTSGGEWLVTEGQNAVLTPSTFGVKKQSSHGVSKIQPVILGKSAIYVQDKGGRIRDLGYEFASDSFAGNDLSLISEHLFEGHTVVAMALASEPFGIVWVLRSDGVLLGLTYQREHKVRAWHQHITDGFIESISTIAEGTRDALYMIVRRVVNGVTVRYVERMESRDVSSAANSFCVDSGLSYNGLPISSLAGLAHLEGRNVSVLADGNVVEGITVVNGSVTLPNAASIVHVGLPFTCAVETLDVDVAGQSTLKGRAISVSRVVLELENSRGGWVGPKHDDGASGLMREIKPRLQSNNYDTVALHSSKNEINIEPGWHKGGGLRIEQRAPLPLAILSIVPTTDVGG